MTTTPIDMVNDRVDIYSHALQQHAEAAPGTIIKNGIIAGSGIAISYNSGTGQATVALSGQGGPNLNVPLVLATGTATAIVANFANAFSVLNPGDIFSVKLAYAITGAATIMVNNLGPYILLDDAGLPLQNGAGAAGAIALCQMGLEGRVRILNSSSLDGINYTSGGSSSGTTPSGGGSTPSTGVSFLVDTSAGTNQSVNPFAWVKVPFNAVKTNTLVNSTLNLDTHGTTLTVGTGENGTWALSANALMQYPYLVYQPGNIAIFAGPSGSPTNIAQQTYGVNSANTNTLMAVTATAHLNVGDQVSVQVNGGGLWGPYIVPYAIIMAGPSTFFSGTRTGS